jgi:hypothetical protein
MKLPSSFKPVPVECELNGEKIYIISMTGIQRNQYRESTKTDAFSAAIVVTLCLCDEAGNRLMSPGNQEDIDELNSIDGALLDRLAIRCLEVSGLTHKDEAQAEKN